MQPKTGTAGLIGCTLMGAAAAGIAMSGAKIDGLLSNNVVDSRRSSTPNTSIGSSFSSIFSLKSVMSAATKSPQTPPTPPLPAAVVAPSTSNFYVPQPVAETIVVSPQTEQLKTVQGINYYFVFCFFFIIVF